MSWTAGLKPKQRAFLAAYAESASVTKAAKACGISRETHYEWKKEPHYAAAFKEAELRAGDALEDEAVRRAKAGVLEPKFVSKGFGKGNTRYLIRKYSDRLLLALLQVKKREYKPNAELTGPGGGPVAVRVTFVDSTLPNAD